MSNMFKYKMNLDADSTIEERDESLSLHAIPYLAFILVSTIITTFFSAIVMILDRFFSGSLDGTYLKLFF